MDLLISEKANQINFPQPYKAEKPMVGIGDFSFEIIWLKFHTKH